MAWAHALKKNDGPTLLVLTFLAFAGTFLGMPAGEVHGEELLVTVRIPENARAGRQTRELLRHRGEVADRVEQLLRGQKLRDRVREVLRVVGVGGFSLPSRAYDTSNTQQSIQLTETAIINKKIVNETRFEFEHSRNEQNADNSIPTIDVQEAFVGGGS